MNKVSVGIVILILVVAVVWFQMGDDAATVENEPPVTTEGGQIEVPVSESPPPRATYEIEIRRRGAELIRQNIVDDFLRKNDVMRYEIAMVNPAAIVASTQEPGGTNLRISLFGEEALQLVPLMVEPRATGTKKGSSRWAGKVLEEEDSLAVFVVAPDTTVLGSVKSVHGWYRIESTGIPPYHFIWQANPAPVGSID